MTDNGFRSAGRGYNKEDVNKYILEQGKKLKAVQDELGEANARIEKASNTPALKSDEIPKMRETIEAQKKEIASLREKLQAKEYAAPTDDEISRRLGGVLLVAQNSADALLASAKTEAEKISSEAKQKADELYKKAQMESKEKALTEKKQIEEKSAKAQAALNSIVNDFNVEFEASVKRLTENLASNIAAGKTKISKATAELDLSGDKK